MNILIAPGQSYGDSSKAQDIDENEELERVLALKHRETLIRGMGTFVPLASVEQRRKNCVCEQGSSTFATECSSARPERWPMCRC